MSVFIQADSGTRIWLCRMFWTWYALNQNERISISIFKIPVKVKISQLRPVFVKLFGEQPVVE